MDGALTKSGTLPDTPYPCVFPPPLSLSIPLGNYSANSANLREMQIEGGRVKGPAQCYTLGGVTEPGAEA